jgi:glycosyltransferase involved in cell wall biosynthesis
MNVQNSGQPTRVSVVTPFYNAAPYLRECVESVLRQTWTSFTYFLVNNQSTDGSLEIANEYARRDPRIRVVTTSRLLPQRENFNFAMAQAPLDSAYCKLISADDWMFPECLERMIAVAESDPEIGLVGAYHLKGTEVRGTGLPYQSTVFSGRDICRRQLLKGDFFFGSPTAVLYRGDLLKERKPFYNAQSLHDDTEAHYEILSKRKFGFVHQILTYMRVDATSELGRTQAWSPQGLDKLICLVKYGPVFLDDQELNAAMRAHERDYYRDYVRGLFSPGSRDFARYHRSGRERVGYRLRGAALSRAALREVVNIVFNPLHSVLRLRAQLMQRWSNARRRDG